jgi:hypothetical protein
MRGSTWLITLVAGPLFYEGLHRGVSLLHKGFHFISFLPQRKAKNKVHHLVQLWCSKEHQIYNISQWHPHNSLESWALQLWDSMIKVHMMHIDLYLVELGRLWLQSLPRSFCHNHYARLPITTNTIWTSCSNNSWALILLICIILSQKLFVPWSVGYLSWK